MLCGLAIRDIVLIERAEIAFAPGLNVLTGETGAGKSILLDALGFALGARPRAPLLREGAAEGEVVAEFALASDHPVQGLLAAAGLPAGEELLLRRTIDAQGRSRAFVNDARCGGETLRALADTLVEVQGRQDERGLLDAKSHRALLDAYGALDPAPVRRLWQRAVEARQALAAAEAGQAAAAREAEWLAHAVAELRALAPMPGEEAELDALRRRLQGAARIREEVARAAGALGSGGAGGLLADAARRLRTAAGRAEGALDAALAALGRVQDELAEAEAAAEAALAALDVRPGDLEAAEERLFALRALARKHRVPPDGLAALADELAARLALAEDGAAALGRLARARDAAEAEHAAAAAALSAARHAAAARLDAAVVAELAPLRLDRARFATAITPAPPGPDGIDSVSFTVATNPGEAPGPLSRIASGGELSRFLLALKVCLAGRGGPLTLVFDEIDRGVGGATADAVGRRLAALASGGQVLAVTHSPQVAARAAHHWRIEKSESGGRTRTEVLALTAAGRVDEIARMLAGERVTAEARAAARALLSA
jgi:DNA repair protein RecN (Recombination protein N)